MSIEIVLYWDQGVPKLTFEIFDEGQNLSPCFFVEAICAFTFVEKYVAVSLISAFLCHLTSKIG